MKKILLAALLLSGCAQQNMPCMRDDEWGTVTSLNRTADPNWSERRTKDTIVVGVRMPDGTKRLCRGQWYPEYDTLRLQQQVTIRKLELSGL